MEKLIVVLCLTFIISCQAQENKNENYSFLELEAYAKQESINYYALDSLGNQVTYFYLERDSMKYPNYYTKKRYLLEVDSSRKIKKVTINQNNTNHAIEADWYFKNLKGYDQSQLYIMRTAKVVKFFLIDTIQKAIPNFPATCGNDWRLIKKDQNFFQFLSREISEKEAIKWLEKEFYF
jgi:hypothetical protein